MDVSKLKRREKPAKAPEPKTTAPASEADIPSANLHKPVRGSKAKKQFVLPIEVITEFESRSREQGYRNRQDSDFFLSVWEFWKQHH